MMETLASLSSARMAERFPFARLVHPGFGLTEGVVALMPAIGEPNLEVASASLGNLTMAFPQVVGGLGRDIGGDGLGGAGSDRGAELAWVRAVAEALERYAMCVHEPGDFVVAAANELGGEALDLDRIPRLSDAEYRNPKCPLRPVDKRRRIRWVRAFSLTHRRDVFVPAALTHLYLRPWDAERFWMPISTGVAAHTDLRQAIASGICEVVERDAIALTWLCRLPLPRLELDAALSPAAAALVRTVSRSQIRQLLFDATTDVGVPTVYTIQLRDGDPVCAQLVNCVTDLDAIAAVGKAMRETTAARSAFRQSKPIPEDVQDFYHLEHGALYCGRPSARREFDFLLEGKQTSPLSGLSGGTSQDTASQVEHLVRQLAGQGREVILVDLTTDELRDVGLWVVRAIIPELVPMSAVHAARFLGMPRIYQYASNYLGHNFGEEHVNPCPQPFA
jgi:ribosomal protein S12 methylthiotransferase accessory factor